MTVSVYNQLRILLFVSMALLMAACVAVAPDNANTTDNTDGDTAGDTGSLTIYSGRNENLVGPLLDLYAEQSGVDVEVRYGDTAEMAATILEEGNNSPADVFYGQDAGALGALASNVRCTELPEDITSLVDARFASPDNQWVGTSGRARVLVYNTDMLNEDDLPASVFDLTDERWRGVVGWAPTNGSFQAFITAMRLTEGDDVTRQWLEGMVANDVQVYGSNTPIVEAVGSGEIEVGLVNHYYLYQFLAENPDFSAANYYFPGGDVGSLINVAGVCVINASENSEQALDFVRFLLSTEAQQYFADETNEYPLANVDVAINPALTPLSEIDSPEIDLSNLEDLQGTLQLLQETGALQ